MSANSVSPPPSAEAGGTATANSIPSTTGTGMYEASVCHSRLPSMSSRRRSSRARMLLSTSRLEMSPISGMSSRRLPPCSAARPISSGPNLSAKFLSCASVSVLATKHQHRMRSIACHNVSTAVLASGDATSMPETSAPIWGWRGVDVDGHLGYLLDQDSPSRSRATLSRKRGEGISAPLPFTPRPACGEREGPVAQRWEGEGHS